MRASCSVKDNNKKERKSSWVGSAVHGNPIRVVEALQVGYPTNYQKNEH